MACCTWGQPLINDQEVYLHPAQSSAPNLCHLPSRWKFRCTFSVSQTYWRRTTSSQENPDELYGPVGASCISFLVHPAFVPPPRFSRLVPRDVLIVSPGLIALPVVRLRVPGQYGW